MKERDKGSENYVYIIQCADGSLYTGWTTDPVRRLDAHNRGRGAKYTRSRRPVELVYLERLKTRGEALGREYAIKQLKRKEKLDLVKDCQRNDLMKGLT